MIKPSPIFSLFLLINGSALVLPAHIYGADGELGDMGSYFRVIWGLLVVLGVILILYGILRKRISLFHTSASQSIKVLEIKPLMAKKALCLIEVRGVEYLLGISSEQITHIATIGSRDDSSFAAALSRADSDTIAPRKEGTEKSFRSTILK